MASFKTRFTNGKTEVWLTPKQLEVIRLTCGGRTSREVGQILDKSHRTPNYHLVRVYDIFQISSRSQLLKKAAAFGILRDIDLEIPRVNNDPIRLTEREREIVSLYVYGMNRGQVADNLYIAVRTVDFHTANVYDKIGVNNQTKLKLWAAGSGMFGQTQMLQSA